MSWEDVFISWAQAPSTAEEQKCANAESQVKRAIAANQPLAAMSVTTFAQGSYRARTNVRQESDVDICVRCNNPFFASYPEGKADTDFGNVPATLTFPQFKNSVFTALCEFFGHDAVHWGKKAFDVQETSRRWDSDVIPTLEMRRYTGTYNTDGSHHYHSGVAFVPDDGSRIENWPNQNYENGVAKNNATARRYKRLVRILKRLRYRMEDDRVSAASNIPSFLIECLVWNVPNHLFGNNTYTSDLRSVIIHTYTATADERLWDEWCEVNELKYLFRSGQAWTREQANTFLLAAWQYVGFQ